MAVAGGLMNFFDAVHGRIELADLETGDPGVVRLLGTPMLDRLRRIKLLGYASHIFPAADHSRYAHALGTMQVMRRLLRQVERNKEIWTESRDALAMFGNPPIDSPQRLTRHMLVAALLQDVGELPYSEATARFLRPCDAVRGTVKTSMGMDPSSWSSKQIFTAVSLLREQAIMQSDLNLLFLVFLITGHYRNESDKTLPGCLKAFRHMLDGEVDADRLDYVYRDAHHTFGGRGTPQAVIDSLLYYDKDGPVFSDPGPVSEFVTTRTALYTKVYFSAENRFRVVLLSTLLRGIIELEPECKNILQGQTWANGLTFHEFQKLDDIWIITFIQRLADDAALVDKLNARARKALKVLVNNLDYECLWINPGASAGESEPLPENLFFDTYSSHEEGFCACATKRIRIESGRYELLGSPMWLEECCGPFKTVFDRSNPLGTDGMLLFKPTDTELGAWQRVKSAIQQGRLHLSLKDADPFSPLRVSSDTRSSSGFTRPAIFISFCWDDAQVVGRLLAALHYRRRQYHVINDPFYRTGEEPSHNSVEAASQAEAVIVLFSEAYVNKYHSAPSGFIAKELKAIGRRREDERLPVATLTASPLSSIKDRVPYDLLGYSEMPNVGEALCNASDAMIDRAIDGVLRSFDASFGNHE